MLARTAAILSGITPDIDARAWAAAVVANGGTVSQMQLGRVSTLIRGLKSAGSWAQLDDAWLLVCENAVQALTSLKQLRLATAVNSPTFAAGVGYSFDGATNYLDTGWIAGSHAVSMTATNVRITTYERTNVSTNTYAASAQNTSNRRIGLRPRQGTANLLVDANCQASTFTLSVQDSRGYTTGARNGSTVADCVAYKNGVAVARTADSGGLGATLPVISLYIGAQNNAGTPASQRGAIEAWVSVGAALTAAQELAEYNAIQNYMVQWGASV